MERHKPVLIDDVLALLEPNAGDRYLDLTAGYGGHAAMVISKIGKSGQAWLFDQDDEAIEYLSEKFAGKANVVITKCNFAGIDYDNLPQFDCILMDLGVSSPQLDEGHRGFSFMSEGELDMRMDRNLKLSAYEIVNTYDEKKLADIFYQYGQERRSRQVARSIGEARRVRPIATTAELAEIVKRASSGGGKIHPATRVFQALRIAVNDELNALERALPKACDKLATGGKLAVISFHSLEDRIVKQYFKSLITPNRDNYGREIDVPSFKLVTKRPIKGSDNDRNNPRSRSAKLRVIEKIN